MSNRHPLRSLHRQRGFLLMETMVGVAIFAIGVIALARCVQNLLDAETLRRQDERARIALENRMAEVEAGAVSVMGEAKPEKLKGLFEGITLRQSYLPAKLKNENNQPLNTVFLVTLTAGWSTPDGEQEKQLIFYARRP
jgi:type II secretory pathway component PulJ